jgi:hypothetical protein
MDVTYDLPSFMRDLPGIRERTFKEPTIISAFRKAGVWPISCSTALTKLRTYSQPRVQPTQPTPTLPIRPITPIPSTFQEVEAGLQRWKNRVPEVFSSPSRASYKNWITGAEGLMATGQLQEFDLRVLRRQVEESKKRASRSRARLQYGGELVAAEAHELRAQKAELLAQKLAAKEARKERQARNQARKQLLRAGIEARKQERLRKKRVAFYTNARLSIPPELEDPIADPEALESEGEYESEYESARSARSARSERSDGNDGNSEMAWE